MHVLSQVTPRDASAVTDTRSASRQGGAWVVLKKAGLHVVGAESFIGDGALERALRRLVEIDARIGIVHGELLAPEVPL